MKGRRIRRPSNRYGAGERIKRQRQRPVTQAQLQRRAVTWARERLPHLERAMGIRRSAINTLLSEAEARFNIGCARAIEKALKIQRNPETEEETVAWESGAEE